MFVLTAPGCKEYVVTPVFLSLLESSFVNRMLHSLLLGYIDEGLLRLVGSNFAYFANMDDTLTILLGRDFFNKSVTH